MEDVRDRVYREFHPDEAKVGDVLIPAGWPRKSANEWRKQEGKRIASVVYHGNGDIRGKGYLPLLGEAWLLLKEAGIIHGD